MLLAVDVGNTNMKFTVFDREKIKVSFRIRTDSTKTSDELGFTLINHLNGQNFDHESIDSVIISSVVPNIMHSLNNAIIKFFKTSPLIVGPGIKTGIKLVRTNPNEVGSDRIVNGVAALAKFGGPIIVADYGTATKFDLFAEDGAFEAAVTCPGVMLSAKSLKTGTAKLPEVEIVNPGSILAKNTITSLQAGLFYGKIGEAEYIIDRMIKEYDHGPINVVVTGGLGRIIYEETDRMQFLEPDLTMHGLRLIYDKNR